MGEPAFGLLLVLTRQLKRAILEAPASWPSRPAMRREMIDIGSPEQGVPLNELALWRDKADSAWLRVFVDVDLPLANLPQMVRDVLPSAVHVERARRADEAAPTAAERVGLGPVELFTRFYTGKLGRGHEPTPESLALFRRLLSEEEHATAEA